MNNTDPRWWPLDRWLRHKKTKKSPANQLINLFQIIYNLICLAFIIYLHTFLKGGNFVQWIEISDTMDYFLLELRHWIAYCEDVTFLPSSQTTSKMSDPLPFLEEALRTLLPGLETSLSCSKTSSHYNKFHFRKYFILTHCYKYQNSFF